jgi:hypothetical protein
MPDLESLSLSERCGQQLAPMAQPVHERLVFLNRLSGLSELRVCLQKGLTDQFFQLLKSIPKLQSNFLWGDDTTFQA